MKSWFESKTMWFNILTGAVNLAGLILIYVDRIGLTDQQAAIFSIILTITVNLGNIHLRKITTTGIK